MKDCGWSCTVLVFERELEAFLDSLLFTRRRPCFWKFSSYTESGCFNLKEEFPSSFTCVNSFKFSILGFLEAFNSVFTYLTPKFAVS